MSEEMNTGENPGKNKNIIGFVLSLVALFLGASLMGWLFIAAGKGAAAIIFLLPIAAIVFSVMGMKESKAAGHKAGLGVAGMIIGIVALLWCVMVFFTLDALNDLSGGMLENMDSIENLEGFEDALRDNIENLENH